MVEYSTANLEANPANIARLQTERDALHRKLEKIQAKNQALSQQLVHTRTIITKLRESVQQAAEPPAEYAWVIGPYDEAGYVPVANAKGRYIAPIQTVEDPPPTPDPTAQTFTGTMAGTTQPDHASSLARLPLEPELFTIGKVVLLNPQHHIIGIVHDLPVGEVMTVQDNIGKERISVTSSSDQVFIVTLADHIDADQLFMGATVLVDRTTLLALDIVASKDLASLVLEEIPDVSWQDIGGLHKQIDAIRDAVELPYLYPEEFISHQLQAPRGLLLYGPPGCGKTMIAKAVANSLAKRISKKSGKTHSSAPFISVKGPELLNKYVGEAERQLRFIFTHARKLSANGNPVIIFFDEMESLFKTRGSGISSDVETTIVPQLLAELDGVEGLENVIFIGASNREDLIDPALLRPGRLDVKIRVERPTKEDGRKILALRMPKSIPVHPSVLANCHGSNELAVDYLIDIAIDAMYSTGPAMEMAEIVFEGGCTQVLYLADLMSGATIHSILARAKLLSVKRALTNEPTGLHEQDFLTAIAEERAENLDLPGFQNPDEWAKISLDVKKRVVAIRPVQSC